MPVAAVPATTVVAVGDGDGGGVAAVVVATTELAGVVGVTAAVETVGTDASVNAPATSTGAVVPEESSELEQATLTSPATASAATPVARTERRLCAILDVLALVGAEPVSARMAHRSR